MMNAIFPAEIIEILDDGRLVINRGSEHSIREKQNFLVYDLGDEIFDPKSKESLGILEITKGRGAVESVQEKMSVLISNNIEYENEIIQEHTIFPSFSTGKKNVKRSHIKPFKGVKIGDYVKPI
jgi:hypothetical protein